MMTLRNRQIFFLLWFISFLLSDQPAVHSQESISSLSPGTLGRDVNPFIGTGGIWYLCGHNSPGVTLPFSSIRLSPDTVAWGGTRAANTSGYFYSDPLVLGFSHTRLLGTGAVDGGNFRIVPSHSGLPLSERRELNAELDHRHERAFPGYYAISFPELGIAAELTATHRTGIHRYTFSRNQTPEIHLHVTSVAGKGRSTEGEARILPEAREIEGSVRTFGSFSQRFGGLKIYFVAQFSRPFERFSSWTNETEASEQASVRGDDAGFSVSFSQDEAARDVELRVAISYVSIANARANLKAETSGKTFEQIVAEAVSHWEEKLARIQITGGTDHQRTIFRTALYRSFQMPTQFSDVNGEYTGFDKQVHKAEDFTYYTDMSLWDTFRTVHPLFNLIARHEQRDMVVSLIKMAEQGGYLPRWPSGTGYTNSMFGTPADIMISESWLKGIHNFDIDTAYSFMKKTAMGPVPEGSPFSGRTGAEHYLKHQYCPADLMKKSVASTIEYGYADHAIARLADSLGHKEDAALFYQHAAYYRNLWNPETQFFQPRNSDGTFSPAFRPDLLTYLDLTEKFTHAYVEGSAWQWRWGVPSDARELIPLFRSREYFVEQLSEFFEKSPAGTGKNPNAWYWHGNQPDLFAVWLFNYAGRPDLTQKWARWILDTKYGINEDGIDGNDDGGTLSAWYVLCSLGLFPVAGTDHYEISSPLWERSEIRIADETLIITTDHATSEYPYVHEILLNGVPIDGFSIRHSEIAAGGILEFRMGRDPAPQR
jgi:predicted alpha-1,2-mannosidase